MNESHVTTADLQLQVFYYYIMLSDRLAENFKQSRTILAPFPPLLFEENSEKDPLENSAEEVGSQTSKL